MLKQGTGTGAHTVNPRGRVGSLGEMERWIGQGALRRRQADRRPKVFERNAFTACLRCGENFYSHGPGVADP